jgi:hypothetical protein
MGLAMDLLEAQAGRLGAAIQGLDRQPPKVAVIGTEGSGKTVFIAALAHRLGEVEPTWLLDPVDMKTQAYVTQVWETLRNGEWPSFTSQAAMHDLRWSLRRPDGPAAELQLVDASGHRLRELFTGDLREIPERLRPLAEYCQGADLVILLINLQDFLGEAAGEQRTYNEMALKFALDFVGARQGEKHCCAVFTQVDQYGDLLEKHGTWHDVAQAVVPKLWSVHFREGNIPIFGLSAVDGTEIRPDEQGMPRRFPALDFKSTGFEPFVGWVKKVLSDWDSQFSQRDLWYRVRNAAIPLGAVLACVLAWFWIFSPAWASVTRWFEPDPPPRIEVLERPLNWPLLEERLVMEGFVPVYRRRYRVEMLITFRNDGGDGSVVVVAHYKGGGLERRFASEPFEVKRGRTYTKKVAFEPVLDSEFEIATTDVEIVR